MRHTVWTYERRRQLLALLEANMTAREIGSIMGKSKNAIIGAVWRNAELRAIGFKGTREKKPKAIVLPVQPKPLEERKDPPPGRLICELGTFHCRWPIWGHDERPPLEQRFYCGHPTAIGSYCAAHHALSVPPPKRMTA